MNHISLKTMIVMQTHTLYRTCFSHDQLVASSVTQGDEDCYLVHRMQSGDWPYSKRSVQGKRKLIPPDLTTVIRSQFYVELSYLQLNISYEIFHDIMAKLLFQSPLVQ